MNLDGLKKRKIKDYERRVGQAAGILGAAMDEIVARGDFSLFEAMEKIVSEMLQGVREVLEKERGRVVNFSQPRAPKK